MDFHFILKIISCLRHPLVLCILHEEIFQYEVTVPVPDKIWTSDTALCKINRALFEMHRNGLLLDEEVTDVTCNCLFCYLIPLPKFTNIIAYECIWNFSPWIGRGVQVEMMPSRMLPSALSVFPKPIFRFRHSVAVLSSSLSAWYHTRPNLHLCISPIINWYLMIVWWILSIHHFCKA